MALAGVELCDTMFLYNVLNQETVYPCLSDPNYLLLLDVRSRINFDISHVITAKFVHRDDENEEEFLVPHDAELETIRFCIVYDDNSNTLSPENPAVRCARLMWNSGSKFPVKILNGGYELFSAIYPFLRTKKVIYMPRELDAITLYPIEIIPQFLYVGKRKRAIDRNLQVELKIDAQINASSEIKEEKFPLRIDCMDLSDIHDGVDGNILPQFDLVCKFIEKHEHRKNRVLIYSENGISRSITLALAYLIYRDRVTLQEAYNYIKTCHFHMRPNRHFVFQLSNWENTVHGRSITDVSDPYY